LLDNSRPSKGGLSFHGEHMSDCWIITASGRKVDLLQPTPEMIAPEDICAALSKLCRFTWHVSRFYSVAEHCWFGSQELEGIHALEFLLHDATEAYMGDMNRPLKLVMPVFQRIEERLDVVIRERFSLPRMCSSEVKRMDLIMLATEKRDLMPPSPDPWPCLAGVDPLDYYLAPMSPDVAEGLMMQALSPAF